MDAAERKEKRERRRLIQRNDIRKERKDGEGIGERERKGWSF